MTEIVVEELRGPAIERRRVEIVERKGIGHPDTMCDAMMEAASIALARCYHERCGRVLHYNLDKCLLVAGRSTPRLGGGTIDAPMRLVLGDRATFTFEGIEIPVAQVASDAIRAWIRQRMRFVDPDDHVVIQSEIQPGSPELRDIFARGAPTANDTSAVVGYAPATRTERVVLGLERHIDSRAFKADFPEAGEDVKVLGIRRDDAIDITAAVAFVDRFVPSQEAYFARKEEMRVALEARAREIAPDLTPRVRLNTLDDPARGEAGMYLTVLGTSAEGADSGEVGRGNRLDGVTSLERPYAAEAPAGKNPASHVGKIYAVLAEELAAEISLEIAEVEEAYVRLASRIGAPLTEPSIASVQLVMRAGSSVREADARVKEIVMKKLRARDLTARLEREGLQPFF